MSYESYRARLTSYGENIQQSVSKATKRSQEQQILNSPTRKEVSINDDIQVHHCLVSDKDMFNIRRFLFLPNTIINNGDYIHYDGFKYLVTSQTTDDVYPQVFAQVCNETFTLKLEGTKVEVGRDDFGRPIYDYPEATPVNIPCILSTKIYSTVDNSSIPLPDGSIMIKIPYKIGQIPPINYVFNYRENPYKVTTIDYDDVVNEVGFIEMRLQRQTGGES